MMPADLVTDSGVLCSQSFQSFVLTSLESACCFQRCAGVPPPPNLTLQVEFVGHDDVSYILLLTAENGCAQVNRE